MSRLADFLARRLWWGLLWLMRRRWMRDLHASAFHLVPPSRRQAAFASHLRQNAFARRYGLLGLRIVITAFLLSVSITVAASITLALLDAGIIVKPEWNSSN